MRKVALVTLHLVVLACLLLNLRSPQAARHSGSPGTDSKSAVETFDTDLSMEDSESETEAAEAVALQSTELPAPQMEINPPQEPFVRNNEFRTEDSRILFKNGHVSYQGTHGGKHQNLTCRFDSVKVGGETIARGGHATAVRSGDAFFYARGAVTERYNMVGDKLEQSFVLAQKPQVEGALTVTQKVTTNLKKLESKSTEILLGSKGQPELAINQAVAYDAAGRSEGLEIAYNAKNHQMTMTVSAAFLANATYPVVIDPTIGSLVTPDAGIAMIDCNALHSQAGGRFLTIGTSATGPFGRFLNSSDGSTSGNQFAVPYAAARGDVAFLASANLHLVAFPTVSNGAEAIGVYTVNAGTGAVSGTSIVFTRADTATISYSFGSVCVAATSNGWMVGFNCVSDEDPDAQDDYDILTWSAECIRLNNTGALSSGANTTVLRSENYQDYFGAPDYYGTEDQDWDGYTIHAACLRDDTTSTDRFCMTWHEYRSYDPDESGDSDIGDNRYRVANAVVSVGTMALLNYNNVETISINFESDSWSDVETPNLAANDSDNEFLQLWDRANFDGYFSIKARRYTSSGAGSGAEFYVKGSQNNSTSDYYNDDVVHSPIAPTGNGSTFLITFRNAGNCYAKELPGASSTLGADINIATTTATEMCNLMSINRIDTHVAILLNTGLQMYELRTVTIPPTITTTTLPNATRGTAYSQTLACTGGSGTASWSVTSGSLPTGLSLSSAGVISGTPTTASTTAVAFTVTVNKGGTDTQDLSILVNGPPTPVISTTALPTFLFGVSNAVDLEFTGTTGTATWAVTVGALPLGTSLNTSTGVISGTPTKTGTSKFTVSCTVSGATATQALVLKVKKALPKTNLVSGKQGTAYTITLPSIGGSGTPSFSVTAGMLPGGLTLTSSTGVLSGTPTLKGTYTFTVQISRGGSNYSQIFKLTIKRP